MTLTSGDVFARAYIRSVEIDQSAAHHPRADRGLEPGAILLAPPARRRPDRLVVSMAEGWRGEIVHAAITDAEGRLKRLQDQGPLVPQLVRPGHGRPQQRDLRLPGLQQELQPVLLRVRPLNVRPDEAPLAPRPPGHPGPAQAAAPPFRGFPASTRTDAPSAMTAPGLPDGGDSGPSPAARPGPVHFLRRLRPGLSRPAPSLHPGHRLGAIEGSARCLLRPDGRVVRRLGDRSPGPRFTVSSAAR